MHPHHDHTPQPALTRRRVHGTVGALAAATFLLSGVSSAAAAPAAAPVAASAATSTAASTAATAFTSTTFAVTQAVTQAATSATRLSSANTVTVVSATKSTSAKAKAKAKARAKAKAKAKRVAKIRAYKARVKKVAKRYPRTAARTMMTTRGYSKAQQNCVIRLWDKESNWRWWADNPSSSAYGIPQALPGSKMASAGRDWRTNPVTQIKWGLKYIKDRYGKPCAAWGHSVRRGWY